MTDGVLLAVLFSGTMALFETGRYLGSVRPTAWYIFLPYGAGLALACWATVLFIAPAFTDPNPPRVVIAVLWLAGVWLLISVVRLRIGLFILMRAMARTRMVPWTAMLAPIGTPDVDGRTLLAGDWTVTPGGVPLWVEDATDHQAVRLVGKCMRVWVDGDRLMGAGRVMAGARLDGLSPEVSIVPGGVGGDGTVFASGRVAGILMGRQPAFADVWLKVDRRHR